MTIQRASAALLLSFGLAARVRAADSPACTAARGDVAKTEAEIADLKTKLAALETALETRKAAEAKACPAVAPAPAARLGVKTVRLPLADVATFVNDAVQGTRVRLHTAGPSGYANDSYIQPGPKLGGGRIPVNVPASNVQAGPFAANVYLNDINSTSLAVTFAGGIFAVNILFESAGPEILVRGPGLSLDVEADNGTALLRLTPGLDASGRPSYSAADAVVNANVRCTSPSPVLASVCNALEPFGTNFLRNEAAQSIRQAVLSPDLRSRLGAAVRALLDAPAGHAAIEKATGQKIGTIRATRFEGDALAIDSD